MDLIEIDGLRLRCVIGCRDEERRDRSDVVIDLVIGTDARPAGDSDDLADAWDYRAAAKAVIADVETSACFTVEALATRIARTVVAGCQAPYARVRVRKPGALRFADSAGVVIERTPGRLPGRRRPAVSAPLRAGARRRPRAACWISGAAEAAAGAAGGPRGRYQQRKRWHRPRPGWRERWRNC